MGSDSLRQRNTNMPKSTPEHGAAVAEDSVDGEHPAGDIKHGSVKQLIRATLLASYFFGCCLSINATQYLGLPLYLVDRNAYYAYMSLTKQSFGLLITTMTQWWSPTLIRISGDESVSGQMRKTADGRLECDFPSRLIMMANHQLYSDWLYLWWIAYTNKMHGAVYIILKQSLRYLPVIGPGMMFFGFVFMSRKMETDKPRLAHRLAQLKERHEGPMSEGAGLDPMWLMVFPEGTNLSDNGRVKSAKWAEKQGIPDMRHLLLPRSTGSFFILNEMKDTVEWLYDCTLAYEGVPRGKFGQDLFTLRSTYFQGRPPKSVNMYWRRFAISSIPLHSSEEFDLWVRERWTEKDQLLEEYLVNGRFPGTGTFSIERQELRGEKAAKEARTSYIETEVRPQHWWEVANIFIVLIGFALLANVMAKLYNIAVYGDVEGWKP